MNKTVTAVLAISALAVNVAGATSNNTVGGTNNTISTNSTSSAVWGFQNNIDANNALAFGTNNAVTGENGFAGGNNATAAGRNSFAFGSHAESLVEYTIAIGNQARTAAYDSIAIGNGAFVSGESSVAFGRSNNVTGENSVAIGANNGTVAGGQSAVVGYNNKIGTQKEQLVFGSNSETTGQGALVFGTHAKALATDALAFGNNTIADKANSVALGTNSVTDDAVNQLQAKVNNTTYVFAGTDATSVVSVGSKDRAGYGGVKHYVRQIQNVAAGRIDASSTDAVNGSQLHAAYDAINTMSEDMDAHNRILANHEQRIDVLEHQTHNALTNLKSDISRLDGRVNKVGAGATALAGLHPMEFNKDDKFSASIAYGHYHNANAVALGLYYRPNEKVLLGIAGTFGSENMYSVSASFKFGKGSDYVAEAKDAQSRISKLEALVAKLMAEIEK
ncbi:YadA-like family protein [uncultured Veillonella sp.]|uniref:YadA-like family protein n=1 Tax=uncultured Veillonella sp. TaxID=159268 RepID=UPI00265EECCB|nr:YadA-like family protein [uncultured Veillonella sp.]